MYLKSKKEQDALILLQRDLNQLALAKYKKAKDTKTKEKKKQKKQNNNLTGDNADTKLPSIYGDSMSPVTKGNSLYQANRNVLLDKIKQFQSKVYDLQTENAIQKRQNQRLMDNVIKLRYNYKSFHQTRYPQSQPPQPQPQPQYIIQPPPMMPMYQPYPYQMMPPQMMPAQMMPPYNMNPAPYQMQQPNQKPSIQPNKSKSYKKKRRLSRFRIAGYVVFFSLFFKKYAKTFTLNRFDKFKQNWMNPTAIHNARDQLADYFRSKIPLNIFQRQQISDLDSLRNIQSSTEKKPKKNIKSKKKIGQKSESDSDDSSDFQSQSQKETAQGQKKLGEESKVFEFYLKIDIAVAFVIEFIKQISNSIMSEQFQERNPYLLFFLSRQFQPDRLHDQSDFKYLNLHQEKGYSQNERLFSELLIIKCLYIHTFVNNSLLSQLAKKFFIDDKKKKNVNQNKIFFSFFIRTSIFKSMVEQYLEKKLQKCPTFPLPKQELLPFIKVITNEDPLKQKAVSFQNNGIDMKHENIEQISKQEMKKKQKQIKAILDNNCEKIMKKLYELRKKQYQLIKIKTLSSKYRTQDNSYFKLHDKSEHQKEKQNIFIKTTHSVMQQSSILSSKISKSQIRLKPYSKQNGKSQKNEKTQKKDKKQKKQEKQKSQKSESSKKPTKKQISEAASQSSSDQD